MTNRMWHSPLVLVAQILYQKAFIHRNGLDHIMDQVMHYISSFIWELGISLKKKPASQIIQISHPHVFKMHALPWCNKALCHPNVNYLLSFEAIIFRKHGTNYKASLKFLWEIQVAQLKGW
uniref:Uncharacterized protein n=1 Tax=Arundo donax TaxID=35708 RepID=A0A0A9B130_ARUDO